jgi:TonB family protein
MPGRPGPLAVAPVTLLLLALLCAPPAALPLGGQGAKAFKGFTLVRQVTDYDKAGREWPAHTETLYVSSGGEWRFVATHPSGQVVETIYLCGRGVFFSDHRNRQLVKFGEVGGCPGPTTAERLRADAKFIRTDYVLGRLAYLHRQDTHGYVEETYFAPELGPFPFRRINYFETYKRVEEPVSLTFGEPEPLQLRPPEDYTLVEQKPVYDPKLGERLEDKPAPRYPPEALAAGISGEVVLQVIVDESGRVMRVSAVRHIPLLADAAVDAAYRARFAPAEREGKTVKVSGLITYEVPAREASPDKATRPTRN